MDYKSTLPARRRRKQQPRLGNLAEGGTWRDLWRTIHQYLKRHVEDPEQNPLPKDFWGYSRRLGERVPRDPFVWEILLLGPEPGHRIDVDGVVGYRGGGTHFWMRRRVYRLRRAQTNRPYRNPLGDGFAIL